MGAAASVDFEEAVNKEKCKELLGDLFIEDIFDSLADENG